MVVLPAGVYTLSRAGASEDANGTGDLDIAGDLTLHGAGALTTEIDGGQLDRVIDVLPASDHAFVDGVTVTGGRTPDGEDGFIDGGGDEVAPTPGGAGGGIRVGGPLTLTDAVVVTNGTGFGGAELLDPDGPCDESTPSANGGDGGGIAVENSELLVSRSTIRGNITGTGVTRAWRTSALSPVTVVAVAASPTTVGRSWSKRARLPGTRPAREEKRF